MQFLLLRPQNYVWIGYYAKQQELFLSLSSM